jgi:Flp pilus assembly protein TadG
MPLANNPSRILRNSRRGAHIVEMALVLPILIMIVFGIIEFARANQIRQTVKQAAYEGARVGITADATVAAVQSQANTVLNSVGITGGDHYRKSESDHHVNRVCYRHRLGERDG